MAQAQQLQQQQQVDPNAPALTFSNDDFKKLDQLIGELPSKYGIVFVDFIRLVNQKNQVLAQRAAEAAKAAEDAKAKDAQNAEVAKEAEDLDF